MRKGIGVLLYIALVGYWGMILVVFIYDYVGYDYVGMFWVIFMKKTCHDVMW